MAKFLIVDDDHAIRRILTEILINEGYEAEVAIDGLAGVKKVNNDNYDAIILDIKMRRMDGMTALEKMHQLSPNTPIIMISAHGDIDLAVKAVKKGAFDFLCKPIDLDQLLITVRSALNKNHLTTTLVSKVGTNQKRSTKVPNVMIGNSSLIQSLKVQIEKAAKANAWVLVTGQNGSGKELVAQHLHHFNDRTNNVLVEVNCAAIPSELIENELFGHEKGSYTGAGKMTKGKFELANGGTLFLDEIGDMSLSAQAKMLRALEEKKITRVGGQKNIPVEVCVIAATNKDLPALINNGLFREDLYYRLAEVEINVPSLDERKEDIPLLVYHFIEKICANNKKPIRAIFPEALQALQNQNWPGNIRQLRNTVRRLLIFGDEKITKENVFEAVKKEDHIKMMVLRLVNKLGSARQVIEYVQQTYIEVDKR